MGLVAKHRQTIGAQNYALEYAYNLAGQLISETYPSGKVVSVGYDANGRLSSVADAQRTYANGFQFQQFGGMLSQINLGNGTAETFGYNDRLQMNLQELKRGSDGLQKYTYGYGQIDANGDLDPMKNNGQLARIESYIGTAKQWTQKFTYDSIGRLKQAEERRGDNNSLTYKQVFDFDRFGNLYRKTSSNPIAGQQNPLLYTPIEDAEISKMTNRFAPATGTVYDDAGAVISDPKFRQMNFAYDANGRMTKATKIGVPDAFTVYDALGNRVATKINEVWQYMIYDAFGNLVAEYGQVEVGFGGVKFVQRDWQGSVRTVTNNNGFVISLTDHQAFGGPIGAGVGLRSTAQGYYGALSSKQGYGLTETDTATGLNHTWFRKHESFAGRWTSPDPYNGSINLRNPQSLNRYSYVENQPTNFVDPSGLLTHPEAPYDPVLYGRNLVGGFVWAALTGGVGRFRSIFEWEGGGTWSAYYFLYSDYMLNEGANLIAMALDRAIDILNKGCWTPELEHGIKAQDENFATLDKSVTKGWSNSFSIHNSEAVESSVVASQTVRTVNPGGPITDPMMVGKAGNGVHDTKLYYAVKYYEGEGAAVIYPTDSLKHLGSAIRWSLGSKVNVEVAKEFLALTENQKCKK